MPQTEVADLVQAFWQHVLQKAAHELVAGKACVEQAARGALPVTDGDAGRIEANDAAVGDGYAVDIARQILEHGVGAVAPGRAVHDPGLAPHRLGDKEVGALLGERGPELAAHEVCERSSRRQIVGPRRTPAGPVRRHAAAGAITRAMRSIRSARVAASIGTAQRCFTRRGEKEMAELLHNPKIKPEHLARKAIVYLRQSSEKQVRQNKESQLLQYAMAERVRALG